MRRPVKTASLFLLLLLVIPMLPGLVGSQSMEWNPRTPPLRIIYTFKSSLSGRGWSPIIMDFAWSSSHPNYIVVGTLKGVSLVSSNNGKELWARVIKAGKGTVRHVAWVGDNIAVLASYNKYLWEYPINMWNTSLLLYDEQGNLKWRVDYHGQPLLSIHPSRGLIAVVDAKWRVDPRLKLLEFTSQKLMVYNDEGEQVWFHELPRGHIVGSLSWSPSGKYLLAKILLSKKPYMGMFSWGAESLTIYDAQGRLVQNITVPKFTETAWGPGDRLAVAYLDRVNGTPRLKVGILSPIKASLKIAASIILKGKRNIPVISWVTWTPWGKAWVGILGWGEAGFTVVAVDPGGDTRLMTPRGGVLGAKPLWSSDGTLLATSTRTEVIVSNRHLEIMFKTHMYQARRMYRWAPEGHLLLIATDSQTLTLYKIEPFTRLDILSLKKEHATLTYNICINGSLGQWCGAGGGKTLTLYLAPGIYNASFTLNSAENLPVKGPIVDYTRKKPLYTDLNINETFSYITISLVDLVKKRSAVLEIRNDAPFTVSYIVSWHKGLYSVTGSLQPGETKNVTLIEWKYRLVIKAALSEKMVVNYSEVIQLTAGRGKTEVVNLKTLGIGVLRLMPSGTVSIIDPRVNSVVKQVEIRSGEKPVDLYLKAGNYVLTVSPSFKLASMIIGPQASVKKMETNVSVHPGEILTISLEQIIEQHLATLIITNKRNTAANILIVTLGKEGKTLLGTPLEIMPAKTTRRIIVPGYSYVIMDLKNNKTIARVKPKQGETLHIIIGENKAQITRTTSSMQSTTKTTTTTIKTVSQSTRERNNSPGERGKNAVILVAGVLIAIIAAAVILLKRR